ncbi:MAG: GntR family transcriptional regulator [bacterium]
MTDRFPLRMIEPFARPSVSDQVFDALQAQVLSLELAPGSKLSEVDVAKQMGVSRQPVRDAFYRLSKLGFLVIRPQRATTVSKISADAVMRARFIRSAIEMETVRAACAKLTDADLAALDTLLEGQLAASEAGEKARFHQLDDQFHHEICSRAGLGFTWDLIRENKGHMDRVRMLSLSFASRRAYDDHLLIMAALKARDGDGAALAMRQHLSRIKEQVDRIRAENHAWFADGEGEGD